MRLGRDYTNCLVYDHLSEEQKAAFRRGEIDLGTMNALALEKAKKDVKLQLEITKALGLNHVELDGDSPNPYLDMSKEERQHIRELAKSYDVTLSLHLPYSYVGGSICAPQESDRRIAVKIHKQCIQFAADVGAIYVNTHPGTAPFWHRVGWYLNLITESLKKSLEELGKMCNDLGIALHLENNTAFDEIFSELPDCIRVVREMREKDVEIFLNFDIGHWFTRADNGKDVPDPPENIMEEIPSDFIKELHLNDYVPGEKMFHPPLHLEWGLLKRANLERYARIVKRKGVETIVLETAFKSVEQVLEGKELLQKETAYIKSIMEA